MGQITKPRVRRVGFSGGPALEDRGQLDHLLTVEVDRALAAVWPRLQTAVAWLA
jgi:hypothetical protein